MGMTFKEARAKAIEAGAAPERIEQMRRATFGGPVFRRNMAAALQMHPWHNDAEAWARLAGALGHIKGGR